MVDLSLIKFCSNLIHKKNSMPLFVTFFVTNKCNLSCTHCFYSSELNKPIKELTLKEIKNLAKSMDHFPVLYIGGGEPFLRKDLVEICSYFYNYNKIKYLVIPTNGSFPNQISKTMDEISNLCPKTSVLLNVSIGGVEKEHNKIRGNSKSYDQAIKTYNLAKSLKPKHDNLKVGFTVTFTATNQNNILRCYNQLKKLNPDNIQLNLIRGSPKNPKEKVVNINKFKKLTQQFHKDVKNKVIPGYDPIHVSAASYRHEMIIKTYKENTFQTLCYASQLSCVIYPDGEVYPCELLDKRIGNVHDYNYNFKELWYSEKNKKLSNWIKKTKCYCTHECNVTCNTFLNHKHFTKIISKSLLKQVTK